MVAKAVRMNFTGTGAGMVGTISSDHVGLIAKIAGSFTYGPYEVTVQDNGPTGMVEVVSRPASAWTDQLKSDMQEAIRQIVLGMALRTGIALEIEWTGANFQAADGPRQVFAWEGFRVVKARDAVQTLGGTAPMRISSHPTTSCELH